MAPRLIRLAIIAVIATAQAQGDAMESCGTAQYFPSEYTCYGNRTLCPVVYSLATTPCSSSGGCYSRQMFSCEGGRLQMLPMATGPFTLTAHGTRPTYQNMTVKACGGYLAVGANARQCTSCSGAGPGVQCESYGNNAVLLPDGQMVCMEVGLDNNRARTGETY